MHEKIKVRGDVFNFLFGTFLNLFRFFSFGEGKNKMCIFKMGKINRRKFIKVAGLLSISPFLSPLLNSCANSVSSISEREPMPDLILEGDEKVIAEKLKGQYQMLKSLYENPGKELTIAFPQGNAYNYLKISFSKDNLSDYPHLKLFNWSSGEVVNVLWGRDGLNPTIKFVDNAGNVITRSGYRLEFPIKSSVSKKRIESAVDWLILGIKVFAVALAIWLGLTIGKYIISAIAFVAFNAMVIGLILVGLSVFIPLVKWILDITGITIEDVVSLFASAVNLIVSTLIGIVNYLTNYFSR